MTGNHWNSLALSLLAAAIICGCAESTKEEQLSGASAPGASQSTPATADASIQLATAMIDVRGMT